MDPELLLEELKAVIEEPLPRWETPGTNEDAQAVTERGARERLARDKVILENEERIARGPKVGHNVFYHEVGRRITSRLFLTLGTEGKKKKFVKKTHRREYLNFSLEKWRGWQKSPSKKRKVSPMND